MDPAGSPPCSMAYRFTTAHALSISLSLVVAHHPSPGRARFQESTRHRTWAIQVSSCQSSVRRSRSTAAADCASSSSTQLRLRVSR